MTKVQSKKKRQRAGTVRSKGWDKRCGTDGCWVGTERQRQRVLMWRVQADCSNFQTRAAAFG